MKLLLPIILLCLLAAAQPTLLHIWSGRPQTLPFTAQTEWRLLSGHGRILAHGSGAVRLELPPLHGPEEATLHLDGKPAARLRIHPPRLLEGTSAEMRLRDHRLTALGLAQRPGAAVLLSDDPRDLEALPRRPRGARLVLFTDKWLFPLAIPPRWTAITLLTAPAPGRLAIRSEGTTQFLECRDGGLFAVRLQDDDGHAALLLPPDFDSDNLNHLLLLQKEIKP